MCVRIKVTCDRPSLENWVELVPVHETVYEVVKYILGKLDLLSIVKPEETEFMYGDRVIPPSARPWWIYNGDTVHLIIHHEVENS